ncbi:uncharacterized protein V1516DRAFT_618175, partial [Lipomyces oligophaga]|uniref:uncharacterized protein n=1 Tax=Lipomyces oligophaga TaxID=45792 RepID=UPI0034CFB0DA
VDTFQDRLDRLRFENIERRRQLCSDVVKSRKRKLSELYFLSRSPLLPITDEIIASEDDYLMAFLEKNDLESGHLFDESSLPPSIQAAQAKRIELSDKVHQSIIRKQGRLPNHTSSSPNLISTQQLSADSSKSMLRQAQPAHRPATATPSSNVPNIAKSAQTVSTPSPTERMTTRVSSGALKQKSVSELLGTPSRHSHIRKQPSLPSSIEPELVVERSTTSLTAPVVPEDIPVKPGVPLVKIFHGIQISPLASLVPYSHKSLTTENYFTSYMESTLVKTVARMDELKRDKKWSLRQPQRFRAPKRTKCHWDYLLEEMHITALQQASLRKIRANIITLLKDMIEDYWLRGKESCCVHSLPPRLLSDEELTTVNNSESNIIVRSILDEPDTKNQCGIFSPRHFAALTPPKDDIFRDMIEELPIVPISKFAMIPFNASPERISTWKARILEESDEASLSGQLRSGEDSAHKPLFISESARRTVYVKAPMPPALKYVEYGVPTIWPPQDDATLLRLAGEFMYNWDVVAENMNIRNSWGVNSNIERRTPWECFQRWMQLEPNFKSTDLRGPYTRAAQAWIEATHRAQTHTKRRMIPIGIPPDNTQRGQRRLRWGGMFEAIRKSIRKREGARRFGATGAAASAAHSSQASHSVQAAHAAQVAQVTQAAQVAAAAHAAHASSAPHAANTSNSAIGSHVAGQVSHLGQSSQVSHGIPAGLSAASLAAATAGFASSHISLSNAHHGVHATAQQIANARQAHAMNNNHQNVVHGGNSSSAMQSTSGSNNHP